MSTEPAGKVVPDYENLLKLVGNKQYDEYINLIYQGFSELDYHNSASLIMLWYSIENIHEIYKNKALHSTYKNIFLLIKERLFYDSIRKQTFDIRFFKMAELVLKSGVKLSKSSDDIALFKRYTELYDQITDPNQHYDKFINASVLFLIQVFRGDGKGAKTSYVGRFGRLITNIIIKKESDLNWLNAYIKPLFELDEFPEIFRKELFGGSFWQHDLISQKAGFLWVVSIFWNIYGLDRKFLDFYEPWVKILNKAIEKDETELVFFLHFPLSHLFLNLTHEQADRKKFNDEVEVPISNYINSKVMQKFNLTPVAETNINDGKVRIGFVYDRVVMNSPFKLLYSLIKNLQATNDGTHEYYVYDIEYMEKSYSDQIWVQKLYEIGVKYTSNHRLIGNDAVRGHYYSHFHKCRLLREKIIEDGIDTLIMCNSREQFNFLFSARTAPKQVYWCHGNFEYDVIGIDSRITHIHGDMQKSDFDFGHFDIEQDELFIQAENEAYKKEAQELRKQYPAGAVILGSIGRIIKMDGEGYLEAVASIMKSNPETIYVACGTSGEETIRLKLEKLGLADRFYFPGWVDSKVYSYLIDIYLNTFPDPSGEAMNEYMKINKNGQMIRIRN